MFYKKYKEYSVLNTNKIGKKGGGNMPKKIAILGAGSGGYAMSAELAQLGYKVNLYEHPNVANNLKPIIEKGGIDIVVPNLKDKPSEPSVKENSEFVKITGKVTSDIKEAVEGVNLIMLVTPAQFRQSFIRLLAPYVEDGQTIVVWQGYFSALQVAGIFKDMGVKKDVTICETDSLIYACKKIGSNRVLVKGKKGKVLVAAFPSNRNENVLRDLKEIFPKCINVKNILETSLNNIGLTLHPASVLLNMYRVERKFYPYFENTGTLLYSYYDVTPGMAEVMEAVDRERIALGKKFDLKISTTKEALLDYYGATGKNLYETLLNCNVYQIQIPPTSLQYRYISEEVPFGFVPIVFLGDQLGVPVPIIKGMTNIACAATKIDYWSEGLTMEKLGLSGKTSEEIMEYANTGK